MSWPSWASGLTRWTFFFYVGTPEVANLRRPCQACRRFRGKASVSCVTVDANILGLVRENTMRCPAAHLALNGSRFEHLLQPHGSHVFVS
jgi:hypothetical protein